MLKATDATRLNDEYQRLVSGLAQSGALPANHAQGPGCRAGTCQDGLASSPVLPADILQQARAGEWRSVHCSTRC